MVGVNWQFPWLRIGSRYALCNPQSVNRQVRIPQFQYPKNHAISASKFTASRISHSQRHLRRVPTLPQSQTLSIYRCACTGSAYRLGAAAPPGEGRTSRQPLAPGATRTATPAAATACGRRSAACCDCPALEHPTASHCSLQLPPTPVAAPRAGLRQGEFCTPPGDAPAA